MYRASIKTKERLANRRLKNSGVKFEEAYGKPFFFEEVSMEIPVDGNIIIKSMAMLPISEFTDNMSVTDVLAGEISRVVAIEEAKKLEQETLAQNNSLEYRALEARGELSEFLEHIRNPRVAVTGDF